MRTLSVLILALPLLAGCGGEQKTKQESVTNILSSTTWQYDNEAILADFKKDGVSDTDLTLVNSILGRLQNSRWNFLKDGTLEILDLKGLQGGTWEYNARQNTLSITVFGTVPSMPLPIESITPEQIVLLPPILEEGDVRSATPKFKRIFKPVSVDEQGAEE
jgi:hypothetical protein